jgi:hypothetical protein
VRTNTDFAVNKDFRTGGTTRVTLRLEVLNVFNTPFFTRMASASVGNASFGQVTTQGNYSRFAQLTARLQF